MIKRSAFIESPSNGSITQSASDRLGITQEIELVRAARDVILRRLTDASPDESKIQLAKWVIENIWTPELEPTP